MHVLAYHLSRVDFLSRVNEEFSPVLQLVYGVGVGGARLHGYHRAIRSALNVALVRLVLLEAVSHDGFALGGGQDICAQSDDAPGRYFELYVHPVALRFHAQQVSLAAGHHVYHLAGELLGHVDGQLLYRLALLSVYLLVDYLRLAHLQLVALAAHGLYQHGEVQYATSAYYPLVGGVFVRFHPQCQVLLQLLVQSVVDMAGSAELSFFSEEGRVVNGEEHAHGRLVDGNGRQRLGVLVVADGVAYLETLQSYHGADVSSVHVIGLHVSHALESVQFLYLCFLLRAVTMADGHVHAVFQHTPVNPSHGYATRVVAVVQRGDEQLRSALQLLRGGNYLHDLVQQVVYVVCWLLPVFCHPSVLCRAIHHGEVQLVFRGVQLTHQVKHHFVNLLGAAAGLVHLVHHHDRLQSYLQGFLQNETSLWHRPLESVYQQDASIGHVEHALHLSAEVGVSRSVYDVYLDTFPVDGNVLGKDGDATFTLQVVGVQHLAAVILSLSE